MLAIGKYPDMDQDISCMYADKSYFCFYGLVYHKRHYIFVPIL